MAYANYVEAVPLASMASSTLTAAYAPINASGLADYCTIIRLTSTSSTDVTISYDGVTDHDYLPAGDTIQLEFQTNALPQNHASAMRQGTIVYAKGTAGTGNIYLAGYFNPVKV